MKLSIVIPFYKYKNYLEECLNSLKDSSFHNFETVLILDKECEDISKLIDSYKEVLHLNVYTCENHGVTYARNLGIEKANGDYIYFLDSDDYVLNDTLEILNNSLQGEDIIYGTVKNTWNNKANYLEKAAKKMEDLDEEELEMKEEERMERVNNFVSSFSSKQSDSILLLYYHIFKKKKGLDNTTVLSSAYKKEFLLSNSIRFNTDFVYYSDFIFLLEALKVCQSTNGCLESIYVKRRHNDPINFPALRQTEDDNRFNERIAVFEEAYALIQNNEALKYCVDKKIINYYLGRFIRRLRRSEKPEWKKERYPALSKVMQNCGSRAIEEYKPEKKAMIASIQENNLNKTLKQVRRYLGKIKFKNSLKNKNILYKLAYYHRYLKQPVLKNVVLFETFNGKNYSDSPKYIYEYLAKNYGNDFKCVWVLNNGSKPKYGGEVVKRFSFKYAYYLARAQYLVFNVRPPLWYRKREEQTFLETWHGTPLKRLVFDQEEVTAASPKYKKEFYAQRKDWDYLISANDFSTETLARCFMFENEMLPYGYPRNDIMYAPNKDEIAIEIKNKLGIPLDKKTILYAPTWRDDEYYGKGQYKFTLKLDLNLLRKRLGNEYVILLRTHQYIADALDTTGMEGFAYNVSKYDDISELYLISDICITDYSSVFFDYANLRRPVLFYTYDIEKYKNQLRGFYIDMNTEVPGPLLYTSEEVVEAIENIDEVNQQYKERYDAFYDRFCHLDDGNASKRVVERVFFQPKK